ncbi:hypothetical protein OIU34_20535 [Pararhizobium sp. BT-229]|uniref:hypothetical protein n=1 Tax=Pararhizobium sp. BT-229 TaxID=2986923 RepID=UPI0021F737C7|nr:hypothetical protein [Pararhizobium sp. BT-229]MCV9964277.1 hypothetical protein [Pararhizobium sp. BT-229]
MRVRIDYPVLTRGIPERSVKERMILLSDAGEFDIPEYSHRDLVRAATLPGAPLFGTNAIYGLDGILYENIADMNQVRSPDYWRASFQFGKHRAFPIERPWAELHKPQYAAIQQVKDDNGSQLSSSLSPEAIANVVAGRENIAPLQNRAQFPCRVIDEQAFVEARDRMRSSVERLILVDGALWRPCHAPVVCYSPLVGLPPTRAINAQVVEGPYFTSPQEFLKPLRHELHIICAASETDEAAALAREITASFPGATAEDHQIRVPLGRMMTVEAPELLATDAVALGVLQCAISASEWMAINLTRGRGGYDDHSSAQDRLLNNLSAASFDDVLTFKGLIDGIARANTHGVDDQLVDHVRAAMNSPLSVSTLREREVSQGIMTACLDRWDNQPITLLAHTGATPPGPPKP